MNGNRICELFGIKYPIIQGCMAGISCPELAAAVSNAGGLGTLSSAKSLEEVRDDIRKTKELTDKPFFVNVTLAFAKDRAHEYVGLLVEEGVKIAATAAGSPAVCIKQLKEGGVKVMHLVSTVGFALKAESAGVDAVVAEGVESGGIQGRDEVTTLTLIPQVVDVVKIPVVAAGGIGDARGFVAALALGAEGVQMGTRFIATTECPVPDEYKDAILKAIDTSSEITGRGKVAARRFKPDFLEDALPGSSATYGGGQVSGLIKDVPTVAELVEEMMRAADLVGNGIKDALSAIS